MGQGVSKSSSPSTQHVFASDTPVRFSQELIDALQASPEVWLQDRDTVRLEFSLPTDLYQTDSTRAKDLELHIQSRVNAELSRLEAEQTRALKELEDQISATPDATTESSHTPTQPGVPDQSASRGGKDHGAKADGDKLRDLGRQSVQKEIEELRQKLKQRRLREDIIGDKAVEKAKQDMVTCLRLNDRRPLDCYKEVEAFKREVGRLEKDFLGRILQ